MRGESDCYSFSTEKAEGAYNATLAQLGEQKLMVDYGVPSFGSPMRGLALWLSVVGRGSLWPVRFYSLDPSSMPQVLPLPENDAQPRVFYPLIFVIGFTITTIVCVLPCIAILRPSGFRPRRGCRWR